MYPADAVGAAVDEMLSVDPDGLGDGELEGLVVELHRQRARLAAVSARLAAVADAR